MSAQHAQRDDAIVAIHGPGRGVCIAALVWAILFSGLAGLFTAGYAMDDPGGWAGFGLVLLWLVPMVGVSLLAWKRPPIAYPLLIAVAVIAVGNGIWQLIDPLSMRDFEDQYGPISAIGSFITMVPLALIWRYRRWQSVLLMGVVASAGLAPEFRSGLHLGSSAAVALPMLLETALLAIAAALASRR